MNKLVIVSALFLIYSCLFSQVWIDTGAKWTYDYWNVSEWGTYTFSYTGDTMILGKQCEKIEILKYRFWEDQFGNTHSSIIPLDAKFSYASGDSVFHYFEGSFYLLYDFSASVGDSWIIAIDDIGPCEDTAIVQVTQTDTITINSQVLRTITLETSSNSFFSLNGICTEKFGIEPKDATQNNFGPFPGYQNCIAIDYDMLTFRCYVDDGFATYNPTSNNCDYLTGFNESQATHLNVYPNPASDKIIIESSGDKLTSLEIYSSRGTLVKQYNLQQRLSNIDVSFMKNGVFFIKLISEKGTAVKKLVKL